jgi:SAM-dependent methyltransferase
MPPGRAKAKGSQVRNSTHSPVGGLQRPAATVSPFHWDQTRGRSLDRYLLGVELEVLDSLLRAEPFGRTVEVGCGSGRLTVHLRARGAEVTAVDHDPEATAAFAAQAAGLVVRADARALPFPTEAFDTAVAVQVLQSVEHEPAVAELARVVRPGGRLVCQVLNRFGYKAALKRLARGDRAGVGGGARETRLASFEALLAREGFEVEAKRGYNWLPFERDSDSRLVAPLARVESALRLRRVAALSPWALVVARRRGPD